MSWFSLSLFAVFALAAAELTQQHILTKKASVFPPRTSAVLTLLVQSVITIPIIILAGKGAEVIFLLQSPLFPRVLLVNAITSVAMVWYLSSFRVKNISISTIFVSFSAVVATAIGILAFQESTSAFKFIGIACVLGAIIVLNLRNISVERNHLYGLLAGIGFGISNAMDKSLTLMIHPFVYIAVGFTITAFFGFLQKPSEILDAIKKSHRQDYLPIIVSGCGYFIYNIATFFSYRLGGEVGRVDAINNSQVFVILLFEVIVLKQTRGIVRRVLAAIVAFTGVALLGMTR